MSQRGSRGPVAAHPMDGPAGRRGTRSDEDSRIRSGVWIEPRNRPEDHLLQGVCAAGDVATDQIRVVRLELRGVHRVPRENAIAEAISRTRRAAHLPALTRATDASLRPAVCTMAQQDHLGTRSMHELAQRYSMVSYTNMHPEILPASATNLLENRAIKNVAVGACYARTDTYPSGVYWIGLELY